MVQAASGPRQARVSIGYDNRTSGGCPWATPGTLGRWEQGISEIRIGYGPGLITGCTSRREGKPCHVLLAGGDKDSLSPNPGRGTYEGFALELARGALGGSYGKDADEAVGPRRSTLRQRRT